MPPPSAAASPAQLSLFDEAGVPLAEPVATRWPAQQQVPLPTDARPRPAPTPGPTPAPAPSSTTEPSPRCILPATFMHPRAQRHIALAGHPVHYELRRMRRRSIGFVVGAEGLCVSAPRWVGLAEVESALREKEAWIVRKLHEQAERARRMQAARIEWRDGAQLPFLGETVILLLDPRCSGAVLHSADDTLPGVPRLTLHLGLPQQATPAQVRDLVQGWLQRQARRVFEERCAHFAPRLGVQVRRIGLSSATTRWGSASADGSIRLHWRLVHFAPSVIDYVVTHELAHLREMNHSPAFWEVVRSVIPDYRHALSSLRQQVLPAFD